MPYQFDWKNNRRFDINFNINSYKHARIFALGLIEHGIRESRMQGPCLQIVPIYIFCL